MADWQPIETAPRYADWWLLWDEESEEPVVATKRSSDGCFFTGDWDFEVKAKWYAPLDPPPAPTTGAP